MDDLKRVVAPKSASPELTWRVSRGLGKVYATTVVFATDQPPHPIFVPAEGAQ